MTTQLWLGSQESFDAYTASTARKLADPKFSAASDYSTEVMSQIYSVQQNVGVINIKGSLVDGSAGYGIFFGQIGYDDIRAALVAAVSNPEVKSILLDVGSGGGHVAGVDDTAQLISRINAVKPVVTYTGSMMGSAALWLGSSASHIVTGKTAVVGSLGVIMVHMDRSEELRAAGVKPTIIRSGTDKALASPYEPLSEKAQANLQSQADFMRGVFLQHVTSSRGVSLANGDKKFGQGQEFVGQQAVAAGLVDTIGTYEDAFLKAQKLSKPSKKNGMKAEMAIFAANCPGDQAVTPAALSDNAAHTEGIDMTQPLTDETLAAMAAGVELEDEDAPNVEAGLTDEAVAAMTAEAVDTAISAVTADHIKAVADLTAAHVTALAEADARMSKFVDIARNSVKTMGIHFGVKADAIAAMTPDQILEEHARLAALFKSKFKVGGVAATAPEGVAKVKASAPPMFAALLKSTAK